MSRALLLRNVLVIAVVKVTVGEPKLIVGVVAAFKFEHCDSTFKIAFFYKILSGVLTFRWLLGNSFKVEFLLLIFYS